MARLGLGLVLHNHQPVGNYGFVIDEVYRAAYAPMMDALERHPGVRVAMHHSGPLFDWLEANRPDYIDRLAALCARGQVEALSGGYYEPILPMIHDADKVGQILRCRITGVQPFGFFATVEDLGGDGLVPASILGNEYFRYDEASQSLIGEQSGETYAMGQKIELKLAEANPASGALRFELPEGRFAGPQRQRKDRVRTTARRGRPGNIRHQGRRRVRHVRDRGADLRHVPHHRARQRPPQRAKLRPGHHLLTRAGTKGDTS